MQRTLTAGTPTMRVNDISLKPKLLVLFLLVGLLPMTLVGWLGYEGFHSAILGTELKSFGQLKTAREIKKFWIETYFDERQRDINGLVEMVDITRTEAFN
ncbi:MAG: hypothetical protein HQL50_14805, partial [Magnetococcales bacterium]|nr:hypothetical protein [Magnetococcales bacterium]